MGAKNCPETPRQQMIGMMYLVLTAMLALNVSKDILAAFDVVDATLTQSNLNVKSAANKQYDALRNSDDPKAATAREKAAKLQTMTDSMVNYIEQTCFDLVKYVDGEDSKAVVEAIAEAKKTGGVPHVAVADMEAKDNFDKPTHFMLGSNTEKVDPQCKAAALKKKLNDYKANALQLIENPNLRKDAESHIMLSTEDHKKNPNKKDDEDRPWEFYNFDHLIAAGSVVLLSKMVGEVKNAEAAVFQALVQEISASDFKIAEFAGHSIAQSKIIFAGEKYMTNIVVAAFDPSMQMDVYYVLGADTLTQAQEGSATHVSGSGAGVELALDGGGVGEHKIAGFIKIIAPDGVGDGDGYKRFYFRDTYHVIPKGGATISADKMNVLYAGIENPITAAGGSDASKLSCSFPGCNIKGTGNGHYNVTPPTSLIGRTVKATVTTSDAIVSQDFRVKKVPDPYSRLGANIYGGKKSKSELTANPIVFASMSEDFVYDLKWTIKSFQVDVVEKGIISTISCSGARFSGDLISKINSAPAGTTFMFTNIKATNPQLGERTFRDVTVRLK